LCTIIIVHNTARQRQLLFILPFLQTNITSQMWPSGGKGGFEEREKYDAKRLQAKNPNKSWTLSGVKKVMQSW